MNDAVGTPPRDDEFLRQLDALPEDQLFIYKLENPDEKIKGLSQHPLQRAAHNHAAYRGRKIHTFRWKDLLYVVRLPVSKEDLKERVTPSGAITQNQEDQSS